MRFYTGFSLIEVIIVIAIFVILIALGTPAYTRYFTHAHRLEAVGILQTLAIQMESYQFANNTYEGATPEALGVNKINLYYEFGIQVNTEKNYVLSADRKSVV